MKIFNWPMWVAKRLKERTILAWWTLWIWGPWAAVKMFFLGIQK